MEWKEGLNMVMKLYEIIGQDNGRSLILMLNPFSIICEEDGRINVTVHQVVHDIEGNLLVDQIIHHVYTFEDGLIKAMEIQKPG